MKRFVVAMAAAAILVVGIAGVAGAAGLLDEQTPQWGCPGYGAWAGGTGYNPTNNPTFAKVAEKLGMSADALAGELKAGKSLAETAKAKNVSLDDLVNIVDAPMDEMMRVMVDNGFMTKEQAEAMDQWREAREKAGLEQNGYFGGMMGRGMMGGGYGPGGMMGGGYGPGGMMGPRFAPGTGSQAPSFGPGGRGSGGMMGGWENRTN